MNRLRLASLAAATVIITIVTISAIQFFYKYSFTTGFDITFTNKSTSQIEGLKLTYHNIKKDIEVPSIKPKSTIKMNINPIEDFGENSMKLFYFDQNGVRNEKVLIGYFEKGYSGKAQVEILSVDEAGRLTIETKEDF